MRQSVLMTQNFSFSHSMSSVLGKGNSDFWQGQSRKRIGGVFFPIIFLPKWWKEVFGAKSEGKTELKHFFHPFSSKSLNVFLLSAGSSSEQVPPRRSKRLRKPKKAKFSTKLKANQTSCPGGTAIPVFTHPDQHSQETAQERDKYWAFLSIPWTKQQQRCFYFLNP